MKTKYDLSIVMPTYNRYDILKKTLEAIKKQTYPKDKFEIVIVDDGSTDNTLRLINNFKKKLNISYHKQDHLGTACARNLGVKKSKSKIILFIDDDVIPKEDFIERHLKIHSSNSNIAVLGLVDWYDGIEVTDFMKYLAPEGPHYHFKSIKNKNNVGFDRFYVANLSIEKKWFKYEQFDPNMKFFEDSDLGYRLKKRGLRIIYDEKIVGYHNNYYDLNKFCNRIFRAGLWINYYLNKYKKEKVHGFLKRRFMTFDTIPFGTFLLKTFANLLIKIRIYFISKRLYWFSCISNSYIEGIEKAKKDQNVKL